MIEKKLISGKIVLISFLCTALIEIFNTVLIINLPEEATNFNIICLINKIILRY